MVSKPSRSSSLHSRGLMRPKNLPVLTYDACPCVCHAYITHLSSPNKDRKHKPANDISKTGNTQPARVANRANRANSTVNVTATRSFDKPQQAQVAPKAERSEVREDALFFPRAIKQTSELLARQGGISARERGCALKIPIRQVTGQVTIRRPRRRLGPSRLPRANASRLFDKLFCLGATAPPPPRPHSPPSPAARLHTKQTPAAKNPRCLLHEHPPTSAKLNKS